MRPLPLRNEVHSRGRLADNTQTIPGLANSNHIKRLTTPHHATKLKYFRRVFHPRADNDVDRWLYMCMLTKASNRAGSLVQSTLPTAEVYTTVCTTTAKQKKTRQTGIPIVPGHTFSSLSSNSIPSVSVFFGETGTPIVQGSKMKHLHSLVFRFVFWWFVLWFVVLQPA